MRNTYQANLLLENNLVDVPNAKGLKPSDARLSLNAVALNSAVIEYSTLDQLSTGIPSRRVVPLSGTITEESNLTLANFELFSQDVLQQIRNADEFFSVNNGEVIPSRTAVTILARIRIKGRTLDGRDAESNEFLYPVEVCNGCRITYPPEMIVQRGGQLACPPPMLNQRMIIKHLLMYVKHCSAAMRHLSIARLAKDSPLTHLHDSFASPLAYLNNGR